MDEQKIIWLFKSSATFYIFLLNVVLLFAIRPKFLFRSPLEEAGAVKKKFFSSTGPLVYILYIALFVASFFLGAMTFVMRTLNSKIS